MNGAGPGAPHTIPFSFLPCCSLPVPRAKGFPVAMGTPWGQGEPTSALAPSRTQGSGAAEVPGLCAAPRSCFPLCSPCTWHGTETLSPKQGGHPAEEPSRQRLLPSCWRQRGSSETEIRWALGRRRLGQTPCWEAFASSSVAASQPRDGLRPGSTALCGTVQEPLQVDPRVHGEAAQAQRGCGSLGRPGHHNEVGVPSGGAPFVSPALGTALHCVPAPCRHCHLQAAALGLCQAPSAQHRDSIASSNPTTTVTHTQQGCTHCSLLHTRAGSHITEPTGAHPTQP